MDTATNVNEPLIIGIHGHAGSGKSTFANMLIESSPFEGAKKLSFAGPIKKMLEALLFDAGIDDIKSRSEILNSWRKDKPLPQLSNISPRLIMQTLGTEWGRQTLGETFWIDLLKTKIESSNHPIIVIDDVRFRNELAMLQSHNAVTIKIEGPPGCNAASPHASECPLENELFDYVLINDGDLYDLDDAAWMFIKVLRSLDRLPQNPSYSTRPPDLRYEPDTFGIP